jgi:hypothetical protein
VAAILVAVLSFAALGTPSADARQLEFPTFIAPGRNLDVSPSTVPGARPFELVNSFATNQSPVNGAVVGPAENIRDLTFELPPGMLATAARFPRCSAESFSANECATISQVGVAELELSGGAPSATVPLFNIVPPFGRAAQFAFHASGVNAYIDVTIRGGDDYGATATMRRISASAGILRSTVRIWGVPGDPLHDALRFNGAGVPVPGPYPDAPPFKPLVSNPTSCNGPLITTMEVSTWQHPLTPIFAAPFEAPGTNSCDQLEFSPTVEAKPTTNLGDSPSGLDVHVHAPQIQDPEGSASAHLRSARFELPAGLEVNAAAANGLGTCTPGQIGLSGISSDRQLIRYDLPPINFSGSFTVSRDGQSTAQISTTATRAQVQAAIETLPGLAGNITVVGASGGWIVTFVGALAGTDVPLLAGTVTDNSSQLIAVTGTGGTFKLEHGGDSTAPLPFDATNVEVQVALKSLPKLGLGNLFPGNVFVNPAGAEENTRFHRAIFTGDLNGQKPVLTAVSSLTGPGAGVIITPSAPPAARGLSVASFGGNAPGTPRFSPAPHNCPDSSKIGAVRIDSPAALDHPVFGSVYLATPEQNPFGTLLAFYITVEDAASGLVVKLPGRVDIDPATGRMTATVSEAPQLPFEDFTLELFKGTLAPLRTPVTCGTFRVETVLTPWSAPEGASRRPKDGFTIAKGAGNTTCASDQASIPDATRFTAGTLDPSAGTYSPFLLRLARPDGARLLTGVDTTLPEGLLAKIAGIPLCSDAALAAAAANSAAAERQSPSCPAASRIGSLDASAGAGPSPYNLTGAAYLSGPYRGAPLSIALVTPALAGPFDLGAAVVRIALHVDPRTTRVQATSDPFPSTLRSLPLDLRSISIALDSGFAKNPTSCYPLEFTGAGAGQSARFQVGDCRKLGFKPKLELALKGSTKRGAHPALNATVTNPVKGTAANFAAVDVVLPKSLRFDKSHIGSAATVYGQATVSTPLLDQPLRGPVRLRHSAKSTQVIVDLDGQVDLTLEGQLQVSKAGAMRVTFDTPPDVPLTKFTLAMAGSKNGLFSVAGGLCGSNGRATAYFDGQNAAASDQRFAIDAGCGKGGKKSKRGRGRKHS